MADVIVDCAELARSGVVVTAYTALTTPPLRPTDRYLVRNNGRMGVFVQTASIATTVRAEIPQTLDGQAVAPKAVVVPANALVGVGHWPADIYNNAQAQIAITFSAVRGVKLFCACMV